METRNRADELADLADLAPHRRVTALRINRGLTHSNVAAAAGVSRHTIKLVEGGYTPRADVMYRIARAFGHWPLDIWPLPVDDDEPVAA